MNNSLWLNKGIEITELSYIEHKEMDNSRLQADKKNAENEVR